MPKLIPFLALLVASNSFAQDCLLTEKTTTKNFGVVQEVRNVKAELGQWKDGYQTCTATLEGSVNGKWGFGTGTYKWNGQSNPERACMAAVELAKKNLLEVQRDSTISDVSVVICKELPPKDQVPLNTKIGQVIDNVNVLRKHPNYPNMFFYNGQYCRWYVEAGWNGKDINQLNGIVCNYNSNKWIVVDKF